MWKTNQKVFRIEEVIKRRGGKQYVQWKGFGNSFNSSVYKNEIGKWIFTSTKYLSENVKVELDFFNYAARSYLKKPNIVNTSDFA